MALTIRDGLRLGFGLALAALLIAIVLAVVASVSTGLKRERIQREASSQKEDELRIARSRTECEGAARSQLGDGESGTFRSQLSVSPSPEGYQVGGTMWIFKGSTSRVVYVDCRVAPSQDGLDVTSVEFTDAR